MTGRVSFTETFAAIELARKAGDAMRRDLAQKPLAALENTTRVRVVPSLAPGEQSLVITGRS